MGGRDALRSESLGMIKDFPAFGVGLGAWPELYPRYQQPPWSALLVREAHNDYVELFAETGLVGFCLLAWFFWMVGRGLTRGLWRVSPKSTSVVAALVAGIGAMLFHEFFDFSLQIPANALLFSLFVGIVLRAGRKESWTGSLLASTLCSRFGSVCLCPAPYCSRSGKDSLSP